MQMRTRVHGSTHTHTCPCNIRARVRVKAGTPARATPRGSQSAEGSAAGMTVTHSTISRQLFTPPPPPQVAIPANYERPPTSPQTGAQRSDLAILRPGTHPQTRARKGSSTMRFFYLVSLSCGCFHSIYDVKYL